MALVCGSRDGMPGATFAIMNLAGTYAELKLNVVERVKHNASKGLKKTSPLDLVAKLY